MTTGALIFAFNNEKIDYIRLAAWNANNIRRHLKIPVAIVTDNTEHRLVRSEFDYIIDAAAERGGTRYFEDYSATVTWNNASRTDSYKLSPWEQTLVLDADYVVASDYLHKFFDSQENFLAYKNSVNVNGNKISALNHFGRFSMPMWWATVMLFRRSQEAELIFNAMLMIKNNWKHYRELYQIDQTNYRNDFALSIALMLINGHTTNVKSIPGNMISVMPEHTLSCSAVDRYSVKYFDSLKKEKIVQLDNVDFHAMGKRDLGDIIETN